MRCKANTDSYLSSPERPCLAGERTCRTDIGKLVFEGMMTIFIVLIFLFIAQNWVLTNSDDTPFTPTSRIFDGRAGVGGPVPCETNKMIDGYTLKLIRQ